MTVWTPVVLCVLSASVLYFCICTCSEQLSMFHMERCSKNMLIIIIIIISFQHHLSKTLHGVRSGSRSSATSVQDSNAHRQVNSHCYLISQGSPTAEAAVGNTQKRNVQPSGKKCSYCQKLNHWAKVCLTKKNYLHSKTKHTVDKRRRR